MSTQRQELTVELRQPGKSGARSARKNKLTPAVVYGSVQNTNLLIDQRLVVKFNTRAFENTLFTLKSSEKHLNNVVALMKSVSVHPVTRVPEHVDLFALDLKKTVRVRVEIDFVGKPAGLAEGGLLNVVNRQVEVECLPTEIPDSFKLDISALGVGDALHVSDLKLPESVKLISSAEMTLAVVNLIEEEVIPVATAEAAPADGAAAAPGAAAPAAAAAGGEAAKDAKAAAPAKDAKAAPAKDKK